MSFYPELDHLSLKELIEYFQELPSEGEDRATYYIEIALLIKKQGENGIKYLHKEADFASEEQLRGILFALTEPPANREKLRQMLFKYLDDQRPMIVAEAIDGLRKLEEKNVAHKVLAMLKHSSPYVRGSVLRFMARLHPNEAIPLLLDQLKDPHFIVRENIADELGDLGIPSVIPYLQPLLSDPHPDVQQAAQTAIHNLSQVI